jgi:hypothetical protein
MVAIPSTASVRRQHHPSQRLGATAALCARSKRFRKR